ncbi:DLW-39 family protein [Actinomyces slackii]|nr:DLW-39 family protein [Actinomyces slackii]
MTTAVFSLAAAAAYAAWLRFEAARMQRAAWAEVTDPVD